MAKSFLIAFCFLTSVLVFHSGVSALKCYSCNSQSSIGSPSCFNEPEEVTECPEPNSVCYTELRYKNKPSGQQLKRFRNEIHDACNERERWQHPCFNRGFCRVIRNSWNQKIFFCACLYGWEGRHCELVIDKDPLDEFSGQQLKRFGGEYVVRYCNATEKLQNVCHNGGSCKVIEIAGEENWLFCVCLAGWEGSHCELIIDNDPRDRPNGQQLKRFMSDYMHSCDANEKIHVPCPWNCNCTAIHITEKETVLLCLCSVDEKGRRLEKKAIAKNPLDRLNGQQLKRFISDYVHSCDANEKIQKPCPWNCMCTAIHITEKKKVLLCVCSNDEEGLRLEKKAIAKNPLDIRDNLRIVKRGCGPETLQSGCRSIDPSSDSDRTDTVCIDVCQTDACNSAPL